MCFFESCQFCAGGRPWQICYYPNGCRPTNISLFLLLAYASDGEDVVAQATFSLLDQDYRPVASYSLTTAMLKFTARRPARGFKEFLKRQDLEQSGHLIDDCFALRVDVHVVMEAPRHAPAYDLHRQIGNLMSSEEGADIEFRVGRDTFRALRLVLSARSPVFRAELLDRPVKDGTNVVVLVEDMEAPVFRAFLTFIYTDTLLEMDPEEEYTITRRLLVAADKYSLERLKLICEYSLCNHVKTGCVATMLELAERFHCPRLKEACFEFVRSSKVLLDVTETEEFKSLARSVRAVAKELVVNFLARGLEKASISRWNQESQVSVIRASTCSATYS
ncbi:hypothetical protein HU200_027313 [Digitaria exilis]|uniref:BTB/POZ domain-containing protein n=1 Tax=Digitaria exilis TaxID=1010633 RepID=A0A835C774_9POAL|nr:hypothetical protein HU200_027313 [Digitaria exilis]